MRNSAIKRTKVSVPMRMIMEEDILDDLLDGEWLDYGSGYGFDADEFNMDKYDPVHGPESLQDNKKYDVITCNYVLNVIEDPDLRHCVVEDIKSLLAPGGKALISVRRDKCQFSDQQYWVELDLPTLKRTSTCEIYLIENGG